MDIFLGYILFLAEIITVVVAIVVVIAAASAVAQKSRPEKKGHISVEKLNEEYQEYEQLLRENILDKQVLKQWEKEKKREEKSDKKSDKSSKSAVNDGISDAEEKRIFVLEFEGDMKASAAEALAQEVTAILTVANPEKDEVIIKIESPGGVVHGYGLAASQLDRIKQKGIQLTVAVDKVAASGGYMMAAIADKIIAAPFAVVGSIGVVAQLPNFNRLLKKHDVDIELHTAGEYKRTLTMLGENTPKAREKFREELEDVHLLFKEFIAERRPQVDLALVATGEHWFGKRALALNLVDELMTSDEYLLTAAKTTSIFTVSYDHKESLMDKLSHQLKLMARRAIQTDRVA